MTVSSTAIGPTRAAKLVNRSKGAIIKAIREGRISGEKNDNGEWRIEPSELFRVYPAANTDTDTNPEKVNVRTPHEINGLQAEIEVLRELVDTLKSERNDLRGRLDQEGQERRQLMARLTDQTIQTTRKTLWQRLRG